MDDADALAVLLADAEPPLDDDVDRDAVADPLDDALPLEWADTVELACSC